MPSLTVENYLKAILQEANKSERPWVPTGRLANALDVSPSSVTAMLKTLSESKLVDHKPYEGVRLTESGQLLAMRMLRRHRLIELFLVKTLRLSWDEVHSEAEHMEHAMSDTLIDRIDEFLGHPAYDPHGDPIPNAEGVLRGEFNDAVPLCTMKPGRHASVARVTEQSSEFLRHLSNIGIELGTRVRVDSVNPMVGIITVALGEKEVPLGIAAAENVLVIPEL